MAQVILQDLKHNTTGRYGSEEEINKGDMLTDGTSHPKRRSSLDFGVEAAAKKRQKVARRFSDFAQIREESAQFFEHSEVDFSVTEVLRDRKRKWEGGDLGEEDENLGYEGGEGAAANADNLGSDLSGIVEGGTGALGAQDVEGGKQEVQKDRSNQVRDRSRKRGKRNVKTDDREGLCDINGSWANSLSGSHLDLMVSVKQLAMERLHSTGENALAGLLTPTALRTISVILQEFVRDRMQTSCPSLQVDEPLGEVPSQK